MQRVCREGRVEEWVELQYRREAQAGIGGEDDGGSGADGNVQVKRGEVGARLEQGWRGWSKVGAGLEKGQIKVGAGLEKGGTRVGAG